MAKKKTSPTASWVWALLFIVSMGAFVGWAWGGGSPTYVFWLFLVGCSVLYIRSLIVALTVVDDRLKTKEGEIIIALAKHLSFMGIIPVAGLVGVLIGLAMHRTARRLLIDIARKGYGAPLVAMLLVYIPAAQAVLAHRLSGLRAVSIKLTWS